MLLEYVCAAACVASAIGGYALARFLARRKAKMDSELYNKDGTINVAGALKELEKLFGSKKDVVVAGLKEALK